MQKNGLPVVVILAIVLALTVMATSIRILAPHYPGYFHLGDVVIFAAALLFGPKTGFVAGGVGSALADLVTGFPMWAPYTFVIKGTQGYIVGALSNPGDPRSEIMGIAGGSLVMILGYAATAAAIVGPAAVPWELAGNLGQAIVGGILALLAVTAIRRAFPNVAGLRAPGKKR